MFEEFSFPEVDLAIAIGGSSSSLRRMVGGVLEHETMERAIRLITRNAAAEVADDFGLDIERVHVLPAGIMILEDISDRIGQPLRIGKGGLREGKLLEVLAARVA
jgi:exopolyphosphatase/guanosine-5'-triphosphate,3'-diphosphate pyrophosphatase